MLAGNELGGLGLTAPPRGDAGGAVGRELAPGRVSDYLRLRDERRALLQLARVCVQEDPGPDRQGELTECPRVTRELDVTAGQDVPCLVVPHRHGRPFGEPQPAQSLLRRDVLAADGEQRPSQGRRPGRIALRDQQRQAVQEQIGGARRARRRGRHTGGSGHVPDRRGQAADEQRGGERLQVGLAGQPDVQRLELPGRAEQERGRVPAMTGGERDLRAQQVAAGTLQFIQRPGLCHGQQAERGVRCASPVPGLRCGQRPLRAARRVERQPGGLLQERGRRRETTAALCPACALLKFGSNFLIWARRGLGPVPGPPVRIGGRVGGLGQRAVQLLPRLDRCRPVGRRAHQRMPEPHPGAELGQSRLHRRPCRPGPIASRPAARHTSTGSPVGSAAASCTSRRVCAGSASSCRPKLSSIRPSSGIRAADPEPARQLRRRQPPRQLQQRQRVPVRVGDDAVPDLRVQRPGQPGQHRLQQRRRIVLGQALHHELGQPGHVLARDPRREHQAHRVGRQPPGREPQRLRRGAVQPLLVIHDAHQRAFPRRLGQQAQHGQAHQEPVRDWPALRPNAVRSASRCGTGRDSA